MKKKYDLKSGKKLLMSSVIMLLVAAISLSTATYAWFTADRAAKVGTLNFKATAPSGMDISLDATNWKHEITLDDLIKAAEGYYDEDGNFIEPCQPDAIVNGPQMTPVSTAGFTNSGVMNFYEGMFSAKGDQFTIKPVTKPIKVEGDTKATTPYYVFDLYFKNGTSDIQELQLGLAGENASKVSAPPVDEDGIKATGVENAVRIGIVDQFAGTGGTYNSVDAIDTYKGVRSVIWEPNAATHRGNIERLINIENNEKGMLPNDEEQETLGRVVDQGALNYLGLNGGSTAPTDCLIGNSTDGTPDEDMYFNAGTSTHINGVDSINLTDSDVNDNFLAPQWYSQVVHPDTKPADGWNEAYMAPLKVKDGVTTASTVEDIVEQVTDAGLDAPSNLGIQTQLVRNHDAATAKDANICPMGGSDSISKVTVYIWIEGQDADCNNVQQGGTVYVDLKFVSTAFDPTDPWMLLTKNGSIVTPPTP